MNKEETPRQVEEAFHLYKCRWGILLLAAAASGISNMQWMQYGIIGDVVMLYYGISFDAVNWSSMIFLLVYVVLVFPMTYILDKYGNRLSMLIGVCGTALGAWIKLGSISPDRYWVLMLGQFIVSVAMVPILALPPKVAAIWFGPSEVSTACGMVLAGLQGGLAVGFAAPPAIIRSQVDVSMIEIDLFTIAFGVAIISTMLMVVVVAWFPDKPMIPPSQAALKSQNQEILFLEPIRKLLTNRVFVLVLIAFAIEIGIFCAISTVLNQVVLAYYADGFLDAGRIGLLMVVAGFFGSLMGGALLDKYKAYKGSLLCSVVLMFLSLIVFTCTLNINIAFVYSSIGFAGFLMGVIWSVSFEVVVEATYPEPEGVAVGFLYALGQAFGICFTELYAALFTDGNALWANISFVLLAFLAVILAASIKMEFRREAVNFTQNTDNLAFDETIISKL